MSQTGMKNNLYTADQFIEIFGGVIADALKRLKELPPTQQIMGQWYTKVEPSTLGYIKYRCSECGEKAEQATKYCGHCGAYMWGEKYD